MNGTIRSSEYQNKLLPWMMMSLCGFKVTFGNRTRYECVGLWENMQIHTQREFFIARPLLLSHVTRFCVTFSFDKIYHPRKMSTAWKSSVRNIKWKLRASEAKQKSRKLSWAFDTSLHHACIILVVRAFIVTLESNSQFSCDSWRTAEQIGA